MSMKTAHRPASRAPLQQFVDDLLEGVLLLEPDGRIAWANTAALAMHDCRRIAELGGNMSAYRRKFVLHYLNNHALKAAQYPLARLVAGESFDGVTVALTVRGDGDFRRVLRQRGLRLADAAGTVDSLALVIEDITDAVSAQERFERTFAANPAPALILRLRDSRYIKVNRGFLEMTGLAEDAVIGRPFHELDVLRRAEHRDAAVAALREHHTITQQEAVLRVGRTDKFVIVAGQPIDMDEDACMLFTFNDLDARKQAEVSLRQSEERFAKAFQLAPVPMFVCVRKGWQVLMANAAFARVAGHDATDLAGRSVPDIGFWKGAGVLDGVLADLGRGRGVRDMEVPLLTRDGVSLDCLLAAEAVTIQDQACFLCVVQDITERKRSEADLVAAIEAVMQDASWFSRTVMEKLAQIRRPDSDAGAELAALTTREREVLELICKGLGDAEIAAALGLSRNTVRNHVATLYDKIGVNRRSAAVVWGRERGLAGY